MLAAIKSRIVHAHRMVRHALRDVGVPGKRSSKWPGIEHDFLKKNPTCAACGGNVHLNVHHQKPFHLDPALELDETNLITLCMEINKHCHLLIGHGDNFKAFNPDVSKMAAMALVANKANDSDTVAKLVAQAKANRQFELKKTA